MEVMRVPWVLFACFVAGGAGDEEVMTEVAWDATSNGTRAVFTYFMVPQKQCVDCAAGTGAWCDGAKAMYEEVIEPDESMCVQQSLSAWEAAVGGILERHDAADVLIVVFWPTSNLLPALVPALSTGSAVVLVAGDAMTYPELDYGANDSGGGERLYKVVPNNFEGAYEQAREFCRITESENKRHVVVSGVSLEERALGFRAGVDEFCGDRGHELYAFEHTMDRDFISGSWETIYNIYAAHFLERPEVSVVLTNYGHHARAAAAAAADFRTEGTFGLLLATNLFGQEDDLDDHVFAGTNVLYQSKGEGMLFVVDRLVTLFKGRREAILGNIATKLIHYSTKLELPDMASSISDQILPAYAAGVAPTSPTPVSVALTDVAVTQVTPTGAFFFEVVGEVTLSWSDARLSYDPSLFNESMVYAAEDIWHPSISFDSYDVAVLRSTPCEVSSDGTVTWSRTVRVQSICDSKLEMFPFDRHKQGRKRVIQRRFNVGVLEAISERNASTL